MENLKICATPGCGKEGKLRCPECVKYKLKDGSFFCGKDCFKGYWAIHKKNHDDCIFYFN